MFTDIVQEILNTADNQTCSLLSLLRSLSLFFYSMKDLKESESYYILKEHKCHLFFRFRLELSTKVYIIFVKKDFMKDIRINTVKVGECYLLSCVWLFDPMDCSLYPWHSPGKKTGVGCHSLLQGIFPTQGSNAGFPYAGRYLNINSIYLKKICYFKAKNCDSAIASHFWNFKRYLLEMAKTTCSQCRGPRFDPWLGN